MSEYVNASYAFIRDICLNILVHFANLDFDGIHGYTLLIIPVAIWLYEMLFG